MATTYINSVTINYTETKRNGIFKLNNKGHVLA